MTTKAKEPKKRQPMVGNADAAQHEELRKLLANHQPQTYGALRREHSLSPIFIETQIAKYPEVFEGPTELSTGKPMIRLKDGKLESREDILMRRVLVKAVKQAGSNGVRLLRLYTNTRISSKDVQRLLEGVSAITLTSKGRDILYRWSGEIETLGVPEQSGIQESEQPAEPLPEPIPESDAELETTCKKLVVLCERTHRHLSWLSNYLDPIKIRRVLDRWPDQFTVETVNLGNVDLIIRNKRCPDAASPPAVADVLVPSEPQVSEPLEKIFSPEGLEILRRKPPCPGMGSRRNGRAIIRGDRVVR